MEKNSAKQKFIILVISSAIFLNFGFFPLKSEAVSLEQSQNGAEEVSEQEMMAKASGISPPFVQNFGQLDSSVKYSTRFFAGNFFVTENNLTYSFKSAAGKEFALKEYFTDKDGRALLFNFSPEDRAETVVSYFKGNDPSKWNSNLASYNTVSLGELYKKVEVKLKISDKNIEKVFYVRPGGAPSDIAAKIRGIESLALAENGELIIKTALGEFRQTKPAAYQEIGGKKNDIDVSYELKSDNSYVFKVGKYNKKFTLVIDPALSQLSASTYIGGSNFVYEASQGIALDSSGNVYIVGRTPSTDFPSTVGAYDTSNDTGSAAFVSKFNNSLTSLLASTFLEGSIDGAEARVVRIDGAGNVYVAGDTYATDFPTTSGAYDETHNGANDIFVTKLDSGLTSISASTFIGGSQDDFGMALDISSGAIIVAGEAGTGFPTTSGAYDETYNGNTDGYIASLNSNLTTLTATYLGGTGDDDGVLGLAVGGGNIYAVGGTWSSDFPTTSGAHDESHNGSDDCFISKLPNTLNTLSASTFYGGSGGDVASAIAIDSSGSLIVSGFTASSDLPTAGTTIYDASYNGGGDVFVAMFVGSLNNLQAATFFGGGMNDSALNLELSDGKAYIGGYTLSSNLPTTVGAYDTSMGGSEDAFLAIIKIDINYTALVGSTFLGGSSREYPFSSDARDIIARDNSGNIYITGHTESNNFPTTAGAYDTSYNGGAADIFVSKISSSQGMKDTLSRLKKNTDANHTIEIDLNSAVNWDAGDTLTLDFQSDFALSALSTADPNDYDIVAGGTEETIVAAGSCGGSDAIEINDITGQVVTFRACGFYTPPGKGSALIIRIGTNATSGATGDSQIKNPTTIGSYIVRFSGTIGDSNACAVGIVDDDSVVITANVDPTFIFQISSNTCDMGNLSTFGYGLCEYNLIVGTNATDGAVITVQAIIPPSEANAWFNLDSDSSKFLANYVEDSGWPPSFTTEAYGVVAQPQTGWTADGDFSDQATPIPDILTQIFSRTTPVDIADRPCKATHFAIITATSPAGSYSQTVQYIATGRF